jgi:hypothetical protein
MTAHHKGKNQGKRDERSNIPLLRIDLRFWRYSRFATYRFTSERVNSSPLLGLWDVEDHVPYGRGYARWVH